MGNEPSSHSIKIPVAKFKHLVDMPDNDENEERIILFWFDPNIESHQTTEQVKHQLHLTNDYVIFFTNLDQCLQFIQPKEHKEPKEPKESKDEKIFLIIPESEALSVLPRVSKIPQIQSIFIVSPGDHMRENLIAKHPKIIGNYINLDDLCQSIREQIEIVYNQLQTFSFFDQRQKLSEDLSKQSAEFLWFQFFNHANTCLSINEQDRIQMSKRYYRTNRRQLQLINQFDRQYQPEDAIHWYSKQSIIYRLINKALRNKDIDLLRTFRFFIFDLSRSLDREHDKILSSEEDLVTVYRRMKLDKKKFDKIKENQGKLISMNGYLLTSRLRQPAVDFEIKPTEQTDVISVLFRIECDVKQLNKSVIFADIAQFSEYPDKREVLFDANSCFRIDSIEHIDSIQLVKMRASNEGQTIINNYIDLLEEKNILIGFGKLICDLGGYDQSQKYFEYLLKNQKGEDAPWVEYHLGRTFAFKRKWKEAREHYNLAYDQMKKDSKQIHYCSRVLSSMGLMLHQQGNDDEAIYYCEQAVKMREEYYASSPVDIAKDLDRIAIILTDLVRYNDALQYYQRALKLREKSHPLDQAKIAENLICIGNIFYRQDKYDEAIDYQRLALQVREQFYPLGHINIARSLNNVANILDQQGKYDEALDYHQKALKIKEEYHPAGHADIGNSLNNIGACYQNQNKKDMALNYYKRASAIYLKTLPVKHPNRMRVERNIHRLSGKK
jgi:tetratricopeptide (TPR) repeat protein